VLETILTMVDTSYGPRTVLIHQPERDDIKNSIDQSNRKDVLAENNTITKGFAKELPLSFLSSRAKHIGAGTAHGNLTRIPAATATLSPNALKPD